MCVFIFFFFFKQKTAYEMRISDWSSDVCSSDLAYPSWYTEGFAELYSTIRFMDDGSFHVGDVPQSRGAALDFLPDIPLERLFDTKASLNDIQRYQEIGRASCRERVCQSV